MIKYCISNTNIEFFSRINYIKSNTSVHKSVLYSLKKYNKTIIDLLIDLKFSLNTCNFCGSYIKPDNIKYKLEYISSNFILITIDRIFYKDENYKYCRGKTCTGKNFSSNSIKFVKTVYSLSDEDAKKYIHLRSSSPFYVENHKSIEDYLKYQNHGKEWFKQNNKDYELYLKSIKYKNSLEYSINLYGKETGTKIYNDTRKNFIIASSHNKIDSSIFYSENSLYNYIYKFHIPLYKTVNISKSYIIGLYYKFKFIQVSCNIQGLTKETFIDNFFNYCLSKYKQNSDTVCLVKTNKFSSLYSTKEGMLLRSGKELMFYFEMCKYKLNEKEYYTDMLYPNQTDTKYRYDFYFPDINTYVEIAGLMHHKKYRKIIYIKKSLFNPTIVTSIRDIINCVSFINNRYKEIFNGN